MFEHSDKRAVRQNIFDLTQDEAHDKLNEIDQYTWDLFNMVREFRLILQDLEKARRLLADR